jgi:hypothetical protein
MKKLSLLFALTASVQLLAQDWELVENLAPTEALESDFGTNMVFADDMLVVSWPRIFTRGAPADNCGEVITYTKNNGMYEELARLTAEDLTGSCVNGDGFGFGLSYDDGQLAIGMPAGARAGIGASSGGNDADSKVFITTFENNNWSLQETLVANDLTNGKGMGFQLVLEDDTLLIHAHEYDSIFGFSFPVSTGVYVFEDSGSGFSEIQKLEENFHLFGQDFDIENQQIIVGAWGEQALNQPGRIYVYEKQGATWTNVQTINDTRNANLGNQIEISGNTLAAGNVQAGGIGGVTIFTKDSSGQWIDSQFIQASDNTFNDQFGISVRLDEDELIVGAGAGQDSLLTLGAVYTFKKNSSGQFIEDQKLIASNPTNLYDRFAGNLIFNDSDMLVNSTSGGFDNADVTSFHHFSRESTNTIPTTYSVNNKVSGVWNASNSENQKVSIEVLADGRAVMFASLNQNNNPLWLIATGEVSAETIIFEDVFSTSGAMFGMNYNSSNVIVSNVGSALLTFSLCNEALISYDFPSIQTSETTIIKDLEIPGNECNNNNKALPSGVSGAWFNKSRSGEGLTNYLFEEDGQQMATITWYTYDANAQQMWVSGTGNVSDNTVNISEMKLYSGAEILNGETQSTVVGSLSMSWDTCHQAQINYDFSPVSLGSGEFDLTQLTILDNTSCDSITK